ncbi:cellulase family glycosylhydrolase [Methylobacterium sp. GC_Met_2]|uniref:glycoside hydrolase family 5 protein n=1 Tax=Methylobacterium sp. GC_Met_2 TaxID=2937376 RepID=UPI00226B755F|nr:cellulase family glycosylhydrolase [Methylobacterium sp. GC_Met_2]
MFGLLCRVLALAINISLLGSAAPAHARIQFNTNSGAPLSQVERFKAGPIPPALVANAGVNVGLFSLFGPVPGVINYNYFDATDAEAAYLAARGVKYVRIPVVWDILQSSPGDPLNAGAIASLKRSIATYARFGMLSMVDLHNFNRRTPPGSTTMDGTTLVYVNSTQIPQSWFVEVWSKLSVALKGNPGVYGYDLMNEPEQTTAADWVTQAQAAIDAIRANGDTTPIIVEGVSNGQPDFATANPNIQTLKDPAKALHFSHHFYPVGAGDNASFNGADAAGSGVTATKLNDRLDPFASWCASYGFKCNIGEYAVGRDSQLWMAMEDAFLTDAERYQIPSFFYFFGANGARDENNIYPFDGVEPRQWAVMAKHNGVTGLPVMTRLLTSVPTAYRSSPITATLDLRGIVPVNATYTFNDGNKGGSFSPASVSMVAGASNFFQTVTYTTPSSDQNVTISVSNNAGQTSPTPVTLVVVGISQNAYVAPSLDNTQSSKAFGFKNGTPSFVGGSTLTDFITPKSGTITTDATGIISDKVLNPSTALKALLPQSGPATIMVEVNSLASSNGAIIGNFGAIPNGTDGTSGTNQQILAFVASGKVYNITSGAPGGIATPQRIVLSWDNKSISGIVTDGTLIETSTSAGISIDQFGGRPDSPDQYFANRITAIAVWPFKGTGAGMRSLASRTTD